MNLQSLREALDAVNKKALKKKFDDRDDKDIDNDGDVDKSDEYLHNKRKAVSKAIDKDDDNGNGNGDDEKEVTVNINMNDKKKKKNGNNDNEVEMNPKVDNMKKSESVKKESFREKLLGILEAQNHTPNKDKAEKAEDNLKGAGAKQMKKDIDDNQEVSDYDRKGHDDVAKAGRVGPSPKPRPNDSKTGDKNVVNKITDDQTQKGRKDLGAEGFKEELSPNAAMKKLFDAFRQVLDEAPSPALNRDKAIKHHQSQAKSHGAWAISHKNFAEPWTQQDGDRRRMKSHADHTEASKQHNIAKDAHQKALDAVKKHGPDSNEYKKAAKDASNSSQNTANHKPAFKGHPVGAMNAPAPAKYQHIYGYPEGKHPAGTPDPK